MSGAPLRLSGYETVRELKRGGMGEVIVARKVGAHGFERLVAVKTIRGELSDSEQVRSMFLDEARLMARLHHPAIAQVHDFTEQDGTLCLVMEYVAGISFADLVKKAPPPAIAVQAIVEACRGLHAAHELLDESGATLGVVHRDVNPQNLMLTFEGQVKILDFGIAWVRGREAPVTQLGMVKGTPPYMAPEQLKNDAVDRRTDVFAAAVVLHELLTGERLFRGDSPYQVARAMELEEIAPPSNKAGDLPSGLDEVVLRGLSRNPDDRFATAADMADALEGCLGGADAEPLAAYASRELAREREDHRAVISGLGAAASDETPAGRATGIMTEVDDPAREPSVDPSSSAPEPGRLWLFVAAVVLLLVGGGLFAFARKTPPPSTDPIERPTFTSERPPSSAAEPSARPSSLPASTASGAPKPPPARLPLPVPRPSSVARAPVAPPTASFAPPPPEPAEKQPEFGFITFGADPYALVQLDGAMIGPTPIIKRRVTAGPHSVALVTPDTGAVRLRRTVQVAPGAVLQVIAR